MAGTRGALIVANHEYTDPALKRLRTLAGDVSGLAAVLSDPWIGGFEVRTLLNEPVRVVNRTLGEFFADRQPDDLLMVYLSCHAVADQRGGLYFTVADSSLHKLTATAVPADAVCRQIRSTRARHRVLLLDCDHSVLERSRTARVGKGIGVWSQLGGQGWTVIAASSPGHYGSEEEFPGAHRAAQSAFTSALIEGLNTGNADRDEDGLVGLDELYDYVRDKIRVTTSNQTPGRWMSGNQGRLIIARRKGGGIFLSYRRQDSGHAAGRLYDRLAQRFGASRVFIDVDKIEPGADFAQAINSAVATCEVLLVIIGPHWLTTTDARRRRLDDADDVVRLEIEAALARDVRVIPILVENAAMPSRQDLPQSLADLARRNAFNVRHESFDRDADGLTAMIQGMIPEPETFWAQGQGIR